VPEPEKSPWRPLKWKPSMTLVKKWSKPSKRKKSMLVMLSLSTRCDIPFSNLNLLRNRPPAELLNSEDLSADPLNSMLKALKLRWSDALKVNSKRERKLSTPLLFTKSTSSTPELKVSWLSSPVILVKLNKKLEIKSIQRFYFTKIQLLIKFIGCWMERRRKGWNRSWCLVHRWSPHARYWMFLLLE